MRLAIDLIAVGVALALVSYDARLLLISALSTVLCLIGVAISRRSDAASRWRFALLVGLLLICAPLVPMAWLGLADPVVSPVEGSAGWVDSPLFARLGVIGGLIAGAVLWFGTPFPSIPRIRQAAFLFLPAVAWLTLFVTSRNPLQTESSPAGAFSVKGVLEVQVDDQGATTVREEFLILPKQSCEAECWSVEDVEPEAAFVSAAAPMPTGTFKGQTINGLRVRRETRGPLALQGVGLLRGKLTVPMQMPRVRIVTYAASDDPTAPPVSSTDVQDVDWITKGNVDIVVHVSTPRNGLLDVWPAGATASLPDRDTATVTLTQLSSVDVYVLRSLRTAATKRVLRSASTADVLMELLAWGFWPVVTILIGGFHKSIAERVKQLFTRRGSRRRAGFKPQADDTKRTG